MVRRKASGTVVRNAPTALAVVALLAAAAGCAPADENATTGASASASAGTRCTKDALATRVPGTLTVGTDNPAYEPWFSDNRPENREGFESAVAYAVAERLGYAPGDVAWTRVTFNNAIAPGPKAYDVDLNQFSITDERRSAVDFSSPYYLVRQTVIALKTSPIAGATTIAALRGATLGAQVGTTSYQAITDVIRPTGRPQVFNSNDDAKKALQNGQLDGLVVDLPTAFYMTSAELDGAVIVGQLPQVGVPEQFGIVLDKGSPLTTCVTGAVDQLRVDGTLAGLEKQWLAGASGARELS